MKIDRENILYGLEKEDKMLISNLLDKYLLIISSCILSFGGLSVHMQVINELVDTDISYKNYFIGRILQVVLSLGISYLISLFAF